MLVLSVLLPVRDAAPWIRSSLASLRRQTFRDFEVIAVDDGSTDGSGDWLERAAATRRRLGAAAARERWRDALTVAGLRELSDFVFVA